MLCCISNSLINTTLGNNANGTNKKWKMVLVISQLVYIYAKYRIKVLFLNLKISIGRSIYSLIAPKKLITSKVDNCWPFLKISSESIHNFLSYLAHKQTNKKFYWLSDRSQKLIYSRLYHFWPFLKISSKSIHNFSSYLAHKQNTKGLLAEVCAVWSLPKINIF